MSEHTPGPWRWGEDADRAQEQIDKDEFEGEKYMDTQLFGANGREIIPVRIDHYEMIYDGDWISDSDRALIAAAPDLLAACEAAREAVLQAHEIAGACRSGHACSFNWDAIQEGHAELGFVLATALKKAREGARCNVPSHGKEE